MKISDDYGVLIVNSVGNSGPLQKSADDVYPTKFAADIKNLILVGASDKNTYRADFSLKSSSDAINDNIVYAPGMDVMAINTDFQSYTSIDGTSFGKCSELGLVLLANES